MKATVVRAFIDKHTGKPYNTGRTYESDDLARIKFLQDAGYLSGAPLPVRDAAMVKDSPKHIGGGMYELPDGSRVKGKQAAIEAMGGEADERTED